MSLEIWLQSMDFYEFVYDEDTQIHYLQRDKPPIMSLEYTDINQFDITCSHINQKMITEQIQKNNSNLQMIIQWILSKHYLESHNQLNSNQINDNNDDDDDLEFSDGEYDEDLSDFDHHRYIPIVPHNKNRQMIIYIWGKALRNTLPAYCQIEKNFNVAVLHGKKSGVDWSQCGSDPLIRRAVMKAQGFMELLRQIVTAIEIYNLTCIGINCRKGRHRSSTFAHLIKHCFFPKTQLVFLEPRSKEQRKFEW